MITKIKNGEGVNGRAHRKESWPFWSYCAFPKHPGHQHLRAIVEARIYFNPRGFGRVYCCIWIKGAAGGSGKGRDTVSAFLRALDAAGYAYTSPFGFSSTGIILLVEKLAQIEGEKEPLLFETNP